MSGWRWSFIPRRLLDDDRYLELSMAERGMLSACYQACDKHGRLRVTPRSLMRQAGIRRDDVGLLVPLHASGLVSIYDVDGVAYAQIEQYAEDSPAELKKSKDERCPHPSAIRAPSDQCSDLIRVPSERHPSSIRVASEYHPSDARIGISGGAGPDSDGAHARPSSDAHPSSIRVASEYDPSSIRAPSGIDETRRDETRRDSVPPLQGGLNARAISDTTSETMDEETERRIQAFTREYTRRLAEDDTVRNKRAGWFGPDGVFEADYKLRQLFAKHRALGNLALEKFWAEHDASGGEEQWKGIELELDNFAFRHGMPTVGQRVVMDIIEGRGA